MKRRLGIKALIGIALLCVLTGVVIATIVLQREITNTFTVEGDYSFDVYTDAECTTPITSIDWGTLQRGQIYASPNFYLWHYGPDPVYIAWTDDNPADITVTMYENNIAYAKNTYVLHGTGSKVSTMRIEILVAGDAAQGSGSFVVTFCGSDTGSD